VFESVAPLSHSAVRTIRYGLLLDRTFLRSHYHDEVFIQVLNFLFGVALVVGFTAYTLLAFLWIKLYHKISYDVLAEDELPHKGKEIFPSLRKRWWIVIYVLVNTFAGSIYLILYLYSMAISSASVQAYANLWLGVMVVAECIFLLIYGRRITRIVKHFTSVSLVPSDRKKFHKIQWFAYASSIAFLLGTLSLLMGLFMPPTMILFLVRHSIYRFFELALMIIISRAVQPSFRTYFLWFGGSAFGKFWKMKCYSGKQEGEHSPELSPSASNNSNSERPTLPVSDSASNVMELVSNSGSS